MFISDEVFEEDEVFANGAEGVEGGLLLIQDTRIHAEALGPILDRDVLIAEEQTTANNINIRLGIVAVGASGGGLELAHLLLPEAEGGGGEGEHGGHFGDGVV